MTSIDMTGDGREQVWTEVIALAHVLEEWVLVGGLMVSLWARHNGVAMPRAVACSRVGEPQ